MIWLQVAHENEEESSTPDELLRRFKTLVSNEENVSTIVDIIENRVNSKNDFSLGTRGYIPSRKEIRDGVNELKEQLMQSGHL